MVNMTYQKKLLRPDEVAEILGLSKRTVYRMILKKDLHAVRIGNGPWRIPSKVIEDIIQEARNGQHTGQADNAPEGQDECNP